MLLVRRSAPVARDGHVWTGRWGPAMSVTNGMARLLFAAAQHAEHRYQDTEYRKHSARGQGQVEPLMQAAFGVSTITSATVRISPVVLSSASLT